MTHASWNNERGGPTGPGHDNERLEYLGDAVLELVVGEYLFRRFPGYDEGQLTQLRAALVNTGSLARLAEKLRLGEALLVGKGAAKTGAHRLPSLLANAFEAMIGAIFLDHGYRVATRVFIQNVGDLADWSDANHKGRLQEVAQERTGQTPHYRVTPVGGPGHKREYSAEALVGGEVMGAGTGTTKQAAEQAAAQAALERLLGKRRRTASAATGAAGAAQRAAAGAATESVRARRRIAEAAAERGGAAVTRRRRPRPLPAEPAGEPPAPAPASSARRRGLLSLLRSAAEVLVGRPSLPALEMEPAPQPAAEGMETAAASPPAPEGAAAAGRRRRGRRGGRGRRRPEPTVDEPQATATEPAVSSAGRPRRRPRPGAAASATAAAAPLTASRPRRRARPPVAGSTDAPAAGPSGEGRS